VSTTNEEIRKFLENAIAENEVMLFMKGTPDQPRCGFSMRTSGALNALGVRYAAMDILPDPRIREELSEISEMYETGELAELLGVEQPEDVEPEPPSVAPPVQSAPMGLENRLND
jgi:monothiol glutaredoxin